METIVPNSSGQRRYNENDGIDVEAYIAYTEHGPWTKSGSVDGDSIVNHKKTVHLLLL